MGAHAALKVATYGKLERVGRRENTSAQREQSVFPAKELPDRRTLPQPIPTNPIDGYPTVLPNSQRLSDRTPPT